MALLHLLQRMGAYADAARQHKYAAAQLGRKAQFQQQHRGDAVDIHADGRRLAQGLADGTADGAQAYPALSTVEVPRAEAGIRAVEKLVNLIRGQTVAPDTVLPVELKLRGSCEIGRAHV